MIIKSKIVVSSVLVLLLCCGCGTNPVQEGSAKELTIERIFSDPKLSGPSPREIQLSQERVTFLKGKSTNFRQLDLWEYHLKDHQSRMLVDSSMFLDQPEKLSAEEKARRERMRLSSDSGIVEYDGSESGNSLVFPIAGSIYYLSMDDKNPKPKRITPKDGHETDAHLSAHGRYVSFVRDSDLYVVETATGREYRITRDGSSVVKNGLSEFIAQEEMGRFEGHWWSSDEKRLAFTRTDESKVEVSKRYEIRADGFEVIEQRYPRAGTPNVKIKLGVVDFADPEASRSKVRWLDLGLDPDIYLARVSWLPDHRTLAAEVESRDQKSLNLIFFDTDTGKKRVVLKESDPHWINLAQNPWFLKSKPEFIWSSERSGIRQLDLYANSGTLLRPLTDSIEPVQKLVGVDEKNGFAYYSASKDGPLEQHLFRVSLRADDKIQAQQITTEPGFHRVSMNVVSPHSPDSANLQNLPNFPNLPNFKEELYYVDRFSSPSQPPQVSVHSVQGDRLAWIEENPLNANHPLAPYLAQWIQPEYGSIVAPALSNSPEKGPLLYYKLFKPKNFQSGHSYPVIVDVYGGPGVQNVALEWTDRDLWHQYLVSHGFVVFVLDSRGSSNRGHHFEDVLYRRMGDAEVEDQKAGVSFLVAQGIADPKRIGVFGWSYGGYLALMSMFRAADTFSAGVAVAPVSDWSLYDTHYVERYLGTPQDNPEGYKLSDALTYAENLKGHLLMIHGMADDNVLFTHSTRIYKALQEKSIPFEMMNYPGSKHGISGKNNQIHVFETVSRFFERNLLN